jgi:hypothetical protein
VGQDSTQIREATGDDSRRMAELMSRHGRQPGGLSSIRSTSTASTSRPKSDGSGPTWPHRRRAGTSSLPMRRIGLLDSSATGSSQVTSRSDTSGRCTSRLTGSGLVSERRCSAPQSLRLRPAARPRHTYGRWPRTLGRSPSMSHVGGSETVRR